MTTGKSVSALAFAGALALALAGCGTMDLEGKRVDYKSATVKVPSLEILIPTPAIRNLIRENKVPQMVSVLQTSQRDGMQTLDQNLQQLLNTNKITQQAALEKCANRKLFGEQ